MSNKTFTKPAEETESGHKKPKSSFHLFVGILLLFFGAYVLYGGVSSLSDNKVRAFAPKGFVTLEVANTDADRKTGLMNRQELARDAGMLFKFDGPQDAGCFWMKDTFIPLDMVWLNAEKKVIHVHSNATPRSEEPICPDEKGAYVIEVVAGRASELGMVVGAQIRF